MHRSVLYFRAGVDGSVDTSHTPQRRLSLIYNCAKLKACVLEISGVPFRIDRCVSVVFVVARQTDHLSRHCPKADKRREEMETSSPHTPTFLLTALLGARTLSWGFRVSVKCCGYVRVSCIVYVDGELKIIGTMLIYIHLDTLIDIVHE